jgi:hypothetical protein
MKYCEECKWFKKEKGLFETNRDKLLHGSCSHEIIARTEVDSMVARIFAPRASYQRYSDKPCGPEGKLWEEKP